MACNRTPAPWEKWRDLIGPEEEEILPAIQKIGWKRLRCVSSGTFTCSYEERRRAPKSAHAKMADALTFRVAASISLPSTAHTVQVSGRIPWDKPGEQTPQLYALRNSRTSVKFLAYRLLARNRAVRGLVLLGASKGERSS